MDVRQRQVEEFAQLCKVPTTFTVSPSSTTPSAAAAHGFT